MHLAVMRFAYLILKEYGTPHTIVDLGGRNQNGTVRALLPRDTHYTAVDIESGPGVDVVSDAADYEHPEKVECVICTEVLEHTPRAKEVVENAMRLLRPGGLLILTCAGPGREPHDNDGHPPGPGVYYRNVEPGEVRDWIGPLVVGAVQHDPERGDIYAWGIKP